MISVAGQETRRTRSEAEQGIPDATPTTVTDKLSVMTRTETKPGSKGAKSKENS